MVTGHLKASRTVLTLVKSVAELSLSMRVRRASRRAVPWGCCCGRVQPSMKAWQVVTCSM